MSQKRDMAGKGQKQPPGEVIAVTGDESVTLTQTLNQMNNGVMLLQAQLAGEVQKNKRAMAKEKQSHAILLEQALKDNAWLVEDVESLQKERQELEVRCRRSEDVCADLEHEIRSLKREKSLLKRKCAEHAEERASLKRAADTDSLTGIHNRSFLEEVAQKRIASEVRAKRSWGLLMVDIDFFKNCNDTYGHTVGDDVLKNIAQKLKKVSRAGDYAIRYGGEEFCILLLDIIDEAEIKAVAERYRAAVASTVTLIEDGEVNVTVSIGACFVPNDSTKDLKSVIILADNALYEAKDSGRNCVVLHDMRKHSCCIRKERRG